MHSWRKRTAANIERCFEQDEPQEVEAKPRQSKLDEYKTIIEAKTEIPCTAAAKRASTLLDEINLIVQDGIPRAKGFHLFFMQERKSSFLGFPISEADRDQRAKNKVEGQCDELHEPFFGMNERNPKQYHQERNHEQNGKQSTQKQHFNARSYHSMNLAFQ